MDYLLFSSMDAPQNLGILMDHVKLNAAALSASCPPRQESIAALLVEAGCNLVIATRGNFD